MKYKIFLFFISLTCFSCLLFIFFSEKKYKQVIKAYRSLVFEMKRENPIPNFYRISNAINFKFNDNKISPKISLLTKDGSVIGLQKFIENKGKVILFSFSQKNCDLCVENELKKIKKIYKGNLPYSSKIVIIGNFAEPNDLEVFKKNNNFQEYEIYNSIQVVLLEELGKPFYCVVDKDFKSKDIFVPLKEMPDITQTYFKLMFEKHFN